MGKGRLFALLALLATAAPRATAGSAPRDFIHGVTISCWSWGQEWGTDAFARELDDLATLGVNWVAIHPYARIEADGTVRFRDLDPDAPPTWLARPIAEAHRRGMGILIKPHIAYWGSPFSWRGAIDFQGPDLERFFTTYRTWILTLARATRGADAFVVGTELDRLTVHEDYWRALIADVRAVTDAKLTYAANHPEFEHVPFWDALDAIGIQAYFPLVPEPPEGAPAPDPTDADLERGWRDIVARLRVVHERTGKPVVFTEMGYNRSLLAAREPWSSHRTGDPAAAEALQLRCYRVALSVLDEERDWLRGAFLWKWFVGERERHEPDFRLDTPALRTVLAQHWVTQ